MKATERASRSAAAQAALCNEIADALGTLWAQPRPSDEAVHQVRKDLKRARAALRLLREAVGEAAYARENRELRDAARPLAEMRDATVALGVLREELQREKKPARRARLLELRRRLHEERLRARARLMRGPQLAKIERALEAAGQRIEYWRVPRSDVPVLRAGLERIYRKGRKAFKAARASGDTEALHESRKQAKYLRQALEVLASGASGPIAKLARSAEAVADRLGDDHDLAQFEAKMASQGDERIEARRARLQKKALKQARRLYRDKPARLAERLLT